jgi:hypothetical protein
VLVVFNCPRWAFIVVCILFTICGYVALTDHLAGSIPPDGQVQQLLPVGDEKVADPFQGARQSHPPDNTDHTSVNSFTRLSSLRFSNYNSFKGLWFNFAKILNIALKTPRYLTSKGRAPLQYFISTVQYGPASFENGSRHHTNRWIRKLRLD